MPGTWYYFTAERITYLGQGKWKVYWNNTAMDPTDFRDYFSSAGCASQVFCSCSMPNGICVPYPEATLWVDVFWYPTIETTESLTAKAVIQNSQGDFYQGQTIIIDGGKTPAKICHLPGGGSFTNEDLAKNCISDDLNTRFACASFDYSIKSIEDVLFVDEDQEAITIPSSHGWQHPPLPLRARPLPPSLFPAPGDSRNLPINIE